MMEAEKSHDTMENQKGWYIKSESEGLIILSLDDEDKKDKGESLSVFHDAYLHQ